MAMTSRTGCRQNATCDPQDFLSGLMGTGVRGGREQTRGSTSTGTHSRRVSRNAGPQSQGRTSPAPLWSRARAVQERPRRAREREISPPKIRRGLWALIDGGTPRSLPAKVLCLPRIRLSLLNTLCARPARCCDSRKVGRRRRRSALGCPSTEVARRTLVKQMATADRQWEFPSGRQSRADVMRAGVPRCLG